jgi:PTH2 family peptidyl-tRNA hydrolase
MIALFLVSFVKICVGCDSEAELLELHEKAKAAGLPVGLIQDNGTTEFHGVPTYTCLAIGPAKSEEIDKITGHLTLL